MGVDVEFVGNLRMEGSEDLFFAVQRLAYVVVLFHSADGDVVTYSAGVVVHFLDHEVGDVFDGEWVDG